MQAVTLCISTTMVLILLGLVVLSVLTARNLSNYVRENLTVAVLLGDSVTEAEAQELAVQLRAQPYSKAVTYISKEQALAEQIAEMGSDPTDFLHVNPFVATLELQMMSDYANRDSLQHIVKSLTEREQVTDVAYQPDLMDSVNRNLQRILLVLLALSALLIIVSYSLISNTVRLSVYSRRFLIHTMKLVGASWAFIRRPFMKQSLVVGLLSSLLASVVLCSIIYGLNQYQPGFNQVIGPAETLLIVAAVFLFGFAITLFCTVISVNRFLHMTAGELYKI